MDTVRPATLDDMDGLFDLGSEMHAESQTLRTHEIHFDQVHGILTEILTNPRDDIFLWVIERDGLVLGALFAESSKDLWTRSRMAFVHAIYVRPRHRTSKSCIRLIKTFLTWARGNSDVIRIDAAAGINDNRAGSTFQKLGLKPRGHYYGMEVT